MSPTHALTERLEEARHARSQRIYDELIARWRALGIGAQIPLVGNEFPDFALPDVRGRYRTLSALLADGPIVLSFNRGEWCPFCRIELEAWHCALPELGLHHGHFVAVTGEVGGRAASLQTILGTGAEVLCDVDHALALTSGLAFFVGQKMIDFYDELGLDLAVLYGSTSGVLPIPATFVIDTDRSVAFAFADIDFRSRAEPADVLAAVAALGR